MQAQLAHQKSHLDTFVRHLLRPLSLPSSSSSSPIERFLYSLLRSKFDLCIKDQEERHGNRADGCNVYAALAKWEWHHNDEQLPFLNTLPLYAQRRFWSLMVIMLRESAIAPGSMVVTGESGCDALPEESESMPIRVQTAQQLARRYLAHCKDGFCRRCCMHVLGLSGYGFHASIDDTEAQIEQDEAELQLLGKWFGDNRSSALFEQIVHSRRNKEEETVDSTGQQNVEQNASLEWSMQDGSLKFTKRKLAAVAAESAEPMDNSQKQQVISSKRRKVDASPERVEKQHQQQKKNDLSKLMSKATQNSAQKIFKQQLAKLKAEDKRAQKINNKQMVKLLMDCTEQRSMDHLLQVLKLDKKLNDQSLLMIAKQWIQLLQDKEQTAVSRINDEMSIESFFCKVFLPRALGLNKAASRMFLDALQLIARRHEAAFVLRFCLPLLSKTTVQSNSSAPFKFHSQHFEIINRVLKAFFTEEKEKRRTKKSGTNEENISSLQQSMSQEAILAIDNSRSRVSLPQFFIHHCVVKSHEELQWSDFLIKTLINVVDSISEVYTSDNAGDTEEDAHMDQLLEQILFILSQHAANFKNSIPFVSLIQSIIRAFHNESELRKSSNLVKEMMQQNETFLSRQIVEELVKRTVNTTIT